MKHSNYKRACACNGKCNVAFNDNGKIKHASDFLMF